MNNDLISRSEAEKLGATCLARRNESGQLEAIISLDNAPTVEIPNYGGQVVPDTLQGWRYEERPQGEAECMEEDAKQASIPYTYNAPQHDWKCGYPDSTRGKEK